MHAEIAKCTQRQLYARRYSYLCPDTANASRDSSLCADI